MGMVEDMSDAYFCGLEIAIPTEPDVLGWAMRDGTP